MRALRRRARKRPRRRSRGRAETPQAGDRWRRRRAIRTPRALVRRTRSNAREGVAPKIARPEVRRNARVLDPQTRKLAEAPNFAHMATSMKDGSPQSAALWVGVEGERLVFYKEADSLALRNLRRDPRLSVSIAAQDDPYESCQLRGR